MDVDDNKMVLFENWNSIRNWICYYKDESYYVFVGLRGYASESASGSGIEHQVDDVKSLGVSSLVTHEARETIFVSPTSQLLPENSLEHKCISKYYRVLPSIAHDYNVMAQITKFQVKI